MKHLRQRLEIIFAYLYGNDLVSVSLVSRSFLAGVIPRLYRSLVFTLNQAKRYPAVRQIYPACWTVRDRL